MIRIRQYLPNFFSGFTLETAEVETLDELLALPWVSQWARSRVGEPSFYRFSVDRKSRPYTLMAEKNGGRRWWVVGFLEQNDVDLPEWVMVRDEN